MGVKVEILCMKFNNLKRTNTYKKIHPQNLRMVCNESLYFPGNKNIYSGEIIDSSMLSDHPIRISVPKVEAQELSGLGLTGEMVEKHTGLSRCPS